jgi:hypothetical protein
LMNGAGSAESPKGKGTRLARVAVAAVLFAVAGGSIDRLCVPTLELAARMAK